MILQPVLLSLKVALLSTGITFILGLFCAYLAVKEKIPNKSLWETIIMLPMILPPSVIGYLLLVLLGKRGVVGGFMQEYFDVQVIFTWGACVIAAVAVSLPLMYQSAKSGFLSVEPIYEEVAGDLGANKRQVFLKVTLPLAKMGMISGVILSFARSLGEFGATLMVAGNIPGKTQTMSTAIYFAVESGNRQQANLLVLIMTVMSFALIFGLNFWMKRRFTNENNLRGNHKRINSEK